MNRTRSRCWCGRKFDARRSLDGVSCHEHDADLTGGDQQPAEPAEPDEDAPRRGPCCCDPWAASEECPVHGDDGHRVVILPGGHDLTGRPATSIVVDDPWFDPDAAARAEPPPF